MITVPLGDFMPCRQAKREPCRQIHTQGIALCRIRRRGKTAELNTAGRQFIRQRQHPGFTEVRIDLREQVICVISGIPHMGNINKAAVAGIDDPKVFMAQADNVCHAKPKAVIVNMLPQITGGQHITDGVKRHRNRPQLCPQIITKCAAGAQPVRRTHLICNRKCLSCHFRGLRRKIGADNRHIRHPALTAG